MKVDYWAKFEENQYYHIYNRGINGVNLFYKSENYRYFLEKWMHYLHPFMRIYAYCLMPNHFHFIASPNLDAINEFDFEGNKENQVLCKRINQIKQREININDFLENQFKDYFGSYSKAINKQQNRTGSLFQQRFKRVLLKDEYALAEKICYIHHNPIHHGFYEQYNEWIFSSYNRFMDGNKTILEKEFVIALFKKIYKTNDVKVKVTDTLKVSVTSDSIISAFQMLHEEYRQKPITDYQEY